MSRNATRHAGSGGGGAVRFHHRYVVHHLHCGGARRPLPRWWQPDAQGVAPTHRRGLIRYAAGPSAPSRQWPADLLLAGGGLP